MRPEIGLGPISEPKTILKFLKISQKQPLRTEASFSRNFGKMKPLSVEAIFWIFFKISEIGSTQKRKQKKKRDKNVIQDEKLLSFFFITPQNYNHIFKF